MKMNFIKSKIMVGVSSFLLLCNAFVPLASAVKPLEGFVNQSTHEIVPGGLSEEMKENFCRIFFKRDGNVLGSECVFDNYTNMDKYGEGGKDGKKFDFYYYGWTPLTWAIYQCRQLYSVPWRQMIKHMIDAGADVYLSADPNADGYPKGKNGKPLPAMSPLQLAARFAYYDVVALVLNKMSDDYKKFSLDLFSDKLEVVESAIKWLKDHHGTLEVPMIPNSEGGVGSLKLDDEYTPLRCTPLFWAALHDRADIVEALCNAGADVNTIGAFQDGEYCFANTVLFIAAYQGYLDVVKKLCEYKPEICSWSRSGEAPPIFGAIHGRKEDIVKYLLTIYSLQDLQSDDILCEVGRPLPRVAVNELNPVNEVDSKILKLIIEKVPVCKLFRYAIQDGKVDVLKWLIDGRYDVNGRCSGCEEPLYHAARRVTYLLEKDPYHYRNEKELKKAIDTTVEIIRLLRQAGAKGDYSRGAEHPEIKEALTEPVVVTKETK